MINYKAIVGSEGEYIIEPVAVGRKCCEKLLYVAQTAYRSSGVETYVVCAAR